MEIILRMNVIEQTAFSLVDEEFRIFPVFLFCSSIRIERSIERFGFIYAYRWKKVWNGNYFSPLSTRKGHESNFV